MKNLDEEQAEQASGGYSGDGANGICIPTPKLPCWMAGSETTGNII